MFVDVYHHSNFGHFLLSASANGLTSIQHLNDQKINQVKIEQHTILTQTKHMLQEYFNGNMTSELVPTDLSLCSEFQINVLKEVSSIPYGCTISYMKLAIKCGGLKYTRAVANANAKNPIPILIPCHRVIGADSNLRGYVFGRAMKQALLALENPSAYNLQGELFK